MKAFIVAMLQKYVLLIIIVLLITALVVVAIMNDRTLQFLGIINPVLGEKALENRCHDRCSSWCMKNEGQAGTGWEDIKLYLPRGEIRCDEVMRGILGDSMGSCTCGTA